MHNTHSHTRRNNIEKFTLGPLCVCRRTFSSLSAFTLWCTITNYITAATAFIQKLTNLINNIIVIALRANPLTLSSSHTLTLAHNHKSNCDEFSARKKVNFFVLLFPIIIYFYFFFLSFQSIQLRAGWGRFWLTMKFNARKQCLRNTNIRNTYARDYGRDFSLVCSKTFHDIYVRLAGRFEQWEHFHRIEMFESNGTKRCKTVAYLNQTNANCRMMGTTKISKATRSRRETR